MCDDLHGGPHPALFIIRVLSDSRTIVNMLCQHRAGAAVLRNSAPQIARPLERIALAIIAALLESLLAGGAAVDLSSVVVRGSSVKASPGSAVYREGLGQPLDRAGARAIVAALIEKYEGDGYSRPQVRVDDALRRARGPAHRGVRAADRRGEDQRRPRAAPRAPGALGLGAAGGEGAVAKPGCRGAAQDARAAGLRWRRPRPAMGRNPTVQTRSRCGLRAVNRQRSGGLRIAGRTRRAQTSARPSRRERTVRGANERRRDVRDGHRLRRVSRARRALERRCRRRTDGCRSRAFSPVPIHTGRGRSDDQYLRDRITAGFLRPLSGVEGRP